MYRMQLFASGPPIHSQEKELTESNSQLHDTEPQLYIVGPIYDLDRQDCMLARPKDTITLSKFDILSRNCDEDPTIAS